ncbi:UNVERIFIED_CONTAM: hypothetical protein Sangu_2934900 [Sesamum angustifolium]|uniref:Uncharacterized protein n=1 Tax=Sesamum angustifolium TaxID=2727405 RepID=A0AAW2IL77_9LAMI
MTTGTMPPPGQGSQGQRPLSPGASRSCASYPIIGGCVPTPLNPANSGVVGSVAVGASSSQGQAWQWDAPLSPTPLLPP